MRFGRRGAFDELVDTQLRLFAVDEAELLQEATEAEERWNRSPRGEAEEAYGDYQLVIDAIADRLLDMREEYARGVDAALADEYRAAFTRAASKQFRRFASLLADLEDTT